MYSSFYKIIIIIVVGLGLLAWRIIAIQDSVDDWADRCIEAGGHPIAVQSRNGWRHCIDTRVIIHVP